MDLSKCFVIKAVTIQNALALLLDPEPSSGSLAWSKFILNKQKDKYGARGMEQQRENIADGGATEDYR